MVATKLILQKLTRTIIVNVVRSGPYKNFYMKIYHTKVS